MNKFVISNIISYLLLVAPVETLGEQTKYFLGSHNIDMLFFQL